MIDAATAAILLVVGEDSFDVVLERLRALDPDVVLAADEVDGDLLDWFATLPLRVRLDRAARMAAELEDLRRARRTG
jgi:hypothetical protein